MVDIEGDGGDGTDAQGGPLSAVPPREARVALQSYDAELARLRGAGVEEHALSSWLQAREVLLQTYPSLADADAAPGTRAMGGPALEWHLRGRPRLLDPRSDDGWLMVDGDVLAELSAPRAQGTDGEILVYARMDGSWTVDRRCTACQVTVELRNPRYREFEAFCAVLDALPCFRPWMGPASLSVAARVENGQLSFEVVEAWRGLGCPGGGTPVVGPRPGASS